MWKDQSASGDDDEGDAAMPAPDSSLPDPVYASLDDYMNQGMQDEAMGPGIAPFYSSPMPFLPFGPYVPYGPYVFYPSPGAPPPPFAPPPPIPPLPHHFRHRLGTLDSDSDDVRAARETPPSFGMSGFGHASRMH